MDKIDPVVELIDILKEFFLTRQLSDTRILKLLDKKYPILQIREYLDTPENMSISGVQVTRNATAFEAVASTTLPSSTYRIEFRTADAETFDETNNIADTQMRLMGVDALCIGETMHPEFDEEELTLREIIVQILDEKMNGLFFIQHNNQFVFFERGYLTGLCFAMAELSAVNNFNENNNKVMVTELSNRTERMLKQFVAEHSALISRAVVLETEHIFDGSRVPCIYLVLRSEPETSSFESQIYQYNILESERKKLARFLGVYVVLLPEVNYEKSFDLTNTPRRIKYEITSGNPQTELSRFHSPFGLPGLPEVKINKN